MSSGGFAYSNIQNNPGFSQVSGGTFTSGGFNGFQSQSSQSGSSNFPSVQPQPAANKYSGASTNGAQPSGSQWQNGGQLNTNNWNDTKSSSGNKQFRQRPSSSEENRGSHNKNYQQTSLGSSLKTKGRK